MKRFHVSVMAIAIAAGFATSPVWGQVRHLDHKHCGQLEQHRPWTSLSGTDYATGADYTANFSVLSGNTVVTDDLATNTIGYLVFGTSAVTLSPAMPTNTLTLQTTVAGNTRTITVGGSTTTMTLALAGSQGFVLNGGGELNFSTAATLLPTGNVVINAGTLQFSGSLSSTATDFVVNNGATLNLGTNTNVGTVVPSSAIYIRSAPVTQPQHWEEADSATEAPPTRCNAP